MDDRGSNSSKASILSLATYLLVQGPFTPEVSDWIMTRVTHITCQGLQSV